MLEHNLLRRRRLLGLWEYLVDPEVGVIREISELPVDDDDPNFFHYLSTSCDTARFTTLKNFSNNGGVSTTRERAIAKAIGEAVERYCSAIFDYDDLLIAPYEALTAPATPPEAYALFLPEQREHLPWAPFTRQSPVAWTAGVSLVSGAQTLVPAAMVYVPYHYLKSRGDTAIAQPISTGLAAGSSFAEAALSGLCEAIERDAFTLTWQAMMRHPRIDPDSVPPSGKELLGRYAEAGIKVQLIDITSDLGVPTVMTIALNHAPTSPAVAVAAATDPSAEVALIKSLEELAHTRKFAKQLLEYTPELPVDVEGGHPQVEGQRDHLRFYCPVASMRFIEFAWSSPRCRAFTEVADHPGLTPTEALSTLTRRVSAAGMDVIACDLTTPDIALLGLSVVRVVVPGLHPLFMGYRTRARGGRRLYEVPQRLGHPGLSPGQPDNPYPHPFP
jgi:ribosomal protein S12 methylthiotransferase accessory factor